MRVVVWLSLPVLIFAVALLYTIVMNWTYGTSYCDTWVRMAVPFCHQTVRPAGPGVAAAR